MFDKGQKQVSALSWDSFEVLTNSYCWLILHLYMRPYHKNPIVHEFLLEQMYVTIKYRKIKVTLDNTVT